MPMPRMEYESYCCTGVQLSFTHSWICYKMGLNLQNYTTSIPRKKKNFCHINGRTDPIKRRSALKSPKFHTPSACIKLTPRTMCNISSLLHLPIGRKFLPRYWWKMVHMKCRWLERRSLFPLRCFGLVFPWAICECVHYFDFWHPTSIAQTGCVSDFLVRNQDLVGAPSRKSEDYGVRLLRKSETYPKKCLKTSLENLMSNPPVLVHHCQYSTRFISRKSKSQPQLPERYICKTNNFYICMNSRKKNTIF